MGTNDTRDLSVLVIDDQPAVRSWVCDVLLDLGVGAVVEAGNGREALALATAPGAAFDLILCDLRMPERDGIETIRALAALGIESAVAIMSVEDDRVIELAGTLASLQGLRMLGTIAKPVTAQKLQPILDRIGLTAPVEDGGPRSAPESDLRDAFGRHELELQYQPKVEVATLRFAGVEALVRWKHPTLGLFQPSAFMPALESSDDYTALLTEFSLREAIACAGRWRLSGRDLPVAINLSAKAFDRLDLPERIETMTLEAKVPTDHVTLEITETQVARDTIRLLDVAMRLRLKGFHLSVDDFGTGQSGLAQLQKVPFTELKIDRQFVDGCAHSTVKRSVVEASVALARTLKMTSVAEGVQNEDDLAVLAELKCDVAQGYFVAKPMSSEGLETWRMIWSQRYP
ncbi:MAG: EAL domain-containing response regulator [Gemmatimonadetes bacterium]|nr:EAL domain-containing response regulator [Gemmatimonadota bacterium]